MNRRQRERRLSRRRDHERETHGRPHYILERSTFTDVKSAHIVPRMYQDAWAIDGQVAVHVDGAKQPVLMPTNKAGTRSRYYRRIRPNGEAIDDIEASLSVLEDKAKPALADLRAGAALTHETKGGLAQFFAVQMVRGPGFFDQRGRLIKDMLDEAGEEAFKPEGLARAGSLEAARARTVELYADATVRLRTMLAYGIKIGTVLAHMRWQVLRFDTPLVAYSDQPVVLWPWLIPATLPFERPNLGPLTALEIRVPLAPDAALLMTWADRSDQVDVPVAPLAAAELNAFTIGQADRQWMHTPGQEPPIADGPLLPVVRLVEPAYTAEVAMRSVARARAERWVARNQHRQWVDGIEVLLDQGPAR
jgi:hypothetical protein